MGLLRKFAIIAAGLWPALACVNAKCVSSDPTCNPALFLARLVERSYSKFLFAVSAGDGTFRSFSIDQETGALSPVSSMTPPAGGIGADIHPSLPVVYTTINGGDGVAAYQFDNDSGSLSSFGSVSPGNANTHRVSVTPSGDAVYFNTVQAGATYLYRAALDATGALQAGVLMDSTEPANSQFMKLDAAGRFLFGTRSGLGGLTTFKVNADGTLNFVATTAFNGTDEMNYASSPVDGSALYGGSGGGRLLSFGIDTSTGALNPIVNTTVPGVGGWLGNVLHPSEQYFYILDSQYIRLFQVNPDKTFTQNTTATVDAGGTGYDNACFDRAGRFLFVTRDRNPGMIQTYKVAADGTLTHLSSVTAGINIRFCVTSIHR